MSREFPFFRKKVEKLPNQKDWNAVAREMLKREMEERNLTYQGLSDKLSSIRVDVSAGALRVKIMRGSFSAAFLLQCLSAIGSDRLRQD